MKKVYFAYGNTICFRCLFFNFKLSFLSQMVIYLLRYLHFIKSLDSFSSCDLFWFFLYFYNQTFITLLTVLIFLCLSIQQKALSNYIAFSVCRLNAWRTFRRSTVFLTSSVLLMYFSRSIMPVIWFLNALNIIFFLRHLYALLSVLLSNTFLFKILKAVNYNYFSKFMFDWTKNSQYLSCFETCK